MMRLWLGDVVRLWEKQDGDVVPGRGKRDQVSTLCQMGTRLIRVIPS